MKKQEKENKNETIFLGRAGKIVALGTFVGISMLSPGAIAQDVQDKSLNDQDLSQQIIIDTEQDIVKTSINICPFADLDLCIGCYQSTFCLIVQNVD